MEECEHKFLDWRSWQLCEKCGKSDVETQHDPFCIARNKQMIKTTYCTYCQLIRKVREDERQKLENS